MEGNIKWNWYQSRSIMWTRCVSRNFELTEIIHFGILLRVWRNITSLLNSICRQYLSSVSIALPGVTESIHSKYSFFVFGFGAQTATNATRSYLYNTHKHQKILYRNHILPRFRRLIQRSIYFPNKIKLQCDSKYSFKIDGILGCYKLEPTADNSWQWL